MATNQLSDTGIRKAKPEPKEYLMADGDGLFLRVRPTGAKDWLFVYTFAGNRRKLGLGSLDAVPLANAREEAAKARISIKQKIDPQLERKQREAEQEAQRAILNNRTTVRDLFEQWSTNELCKRKDGGKEIWRMFEKDVLPAIGTLPVEDVKKGHVAAMTNAILARGVDRMAKLIFSLVRQMFRYAQDCDIIEADPTATIRKHKIGGKDTERDRVLSGEEIRELRDKVPTANLMQSSEAAIWIALSTLCRIGELLNARWADVDLERGVWTIPAGNSKNGKAHTIYMSDFALSHFYSLYKVNGSSEWCYPNRDGNGAVCSKTITKQVGDRQRLEAMTNRAQATGALRLSGGRWTMHDLRRTGATMMSALGVLPDIIERCLNHTEENKVKRIYQRHGYEAEQREAWRLLGERLELLLRDDDNVVLLRGVA